MKIFVPFSEQIVAEHGLAIGKLVPFQLAYECLRVDATAEDPNVPATEPAHNAEIASALDA